MYNMSKKSAKKTTKKTTNGPGEAQTGMENVRALIPAYNDTFIHFLFGVRGHEPILLHLVNAFLENARQVLAKSVEIRNPFNPKTFVNAKHTVLDVRATDERGDYFQVEVQTTDQTAFAERMTYYASKTYSGQLVSGDAYSKLKRVIGIAVTIFELFPELRDIHNVFLLRATANPDVIFTDRIQMHTLEVIEKKMHLVGELLPALAAWVNFFHFSHLIIEADMSTLLKDQPMVQRAYEKFKQFNQSEELRALDEARERFLHDMATDIEVAETKATVEIARKMKGMGLGAEVIAQATGLSVDEIERMN